MVNGSFCEAHQVSGEMGCGLGVVVWAVWVVVWAVWVVAWAVWVVVCVWALLCGLSFVDRAGSVYEPAARGRSLPVDDCTAYNSLDRLRCMGSIAPHGIVCTGGWINTYK